MSILRLVTGGDDLFYVDTCNNNNSSNRNRNYISKLSQITQEEVDEKIMATWERMLQQGKRPVPNIFLLDLIKKMLKVDPKERITTQELAL